MDNATYPLNQIMPEETAVIVSLPAEPSLRRRLIDLGFSPETQVTCVLRQKGGEIAAYLVRGTVIALRKEDSAEIYVKLPADGPRNRCGRPG